MHKGDHLRAVVDIPTIGLSYFCAPFTGGFRCILPKGAVLRVYHEPDASALGFNCTLLDPDLEASLVPREDRMNEKYAGHAFAFGLGDIGRHLQRVEGMGGTPTT